jgi:hypothetical protein
MGRRSFIFILLFCFVVFLADGLGDLGKDGKCFWGVLEVWNGEFIISILSCRESGNDL